MQIAYLLSEYPTLGHTYLLREVRGLRELGWDIQTISIRQPGKRPAPLSPAEQQEYNSTWYILGSGPLAILAAHLATFASRPARYFRGFAHRLQDRPLPSSFHGAGVGVLQGSGRCRRSPAPRRHRARPFGLHHHGRSHHEPDFRHPPVDDDSWSVGILRSRRLPHPRQSCRG